MCQAVLEGPDAELDEVNGVSVPPGELVFRSQVGQWAEPSRLASLASCTCWIH
jgi:hypothetical protein